MSRKDVIWVEGERELFLNMQRRMDTSLSAAREAIRKGAAAIVNDAKENLRDGGNIATGQLRKSGRVQAVEGDADAVDAGFFSDNTAGGYAYFVENGRRSGKMPPVNYIAQWLRKKTATGKGIKNAFASAAAFAGKRAEAYILSLAWAIAKSIAKNGTQPHPFFAPAVEKNHKAITDAISEAVKKETEKNGK